MAGGQVWRCLIICLNTFDWFRFRSHKGMLDQVMVSFVIGIVSFRFELCLAKGFQFHWKNSNATSCILLPYAFWSYILHFLQSSLKLLSFCISGPSLYICFTYIVHLDHLPVSLGSFVIQLRWIGPYKSTAPKDFSEKFLDEFLDFSSIYFYQNFYYLFFCLLPLAHQDAG